MLKESEAIVLRSYPLREADLLVSFFTRSEGKVRGVARAAKRSKRRFGGALEPLTHVRLFWEDRERSELARLDACEVLRSPLSDQIDYPRAVATYAAAFARRYARLVRWYTPLNEPLVNAQMCGKRGIWPPYLRGDNG